MGVTGVTGATGAIGTIGAIGLGKFFRAVSMLSKI